MAALSNGECVRRGFGAAIPSFLLELGIHLGVPRLQRRNLTPAIFLSSVHVQICRTLGLPIIDSDTLVLLPFLNSTDEPSYFLDWFMDPEYFMFEGCQCGQVGHCHFYAHTYAPHRTS